MARRLNVSQSYYASSAIYASVAYDSLLVATYDTQSLAMFGNIYHIKLSTYELETEFQFIGKV